MDTLTGLHRKATPPQPKRAKIFFASPVFRACSMIY
nr:MAG TPA: hypothetical protein [Bacteriophage sp.]